MRNFALCSSLAVAMLMSGDAYANQFKTSLIVLTSGNVEGAGTDSNIYVKLYGPDGVSQRLRLQDFANASGPADILEKGAREIYNLGVDVGPVVTRIQIESDGKHPGSDWHLDRIFAFTTNADKPGAQAVTAPFLLLAGTVPKITDGSAIISTFIYENWLKGDETHENVLDATKHDAGILLARKEPTVRETGSKIEQPMSVVVISAADALGSKDKVDRTWDMTITTSNSLTLSEGTSNSVGLGAEMSFAYEAGGGSASATLSAEYQYLKESLQETGSSSETSVTTSDTFTAAPGTIQFRIGRAEGTVAVQTYESLLQDKTFTGRYVQNASKFNPSEITLTAGTPEDDKWNLDVAPEYAAAVGKGGYDRMVKLLKRYNAVTNPVTYEQAMAN